MIANQPHPEAIYYVLPLTPHAWRRTGLRKNLLPDGSATQYI